MIYEWYINNVGYFMGIIQALNLYLLFKVWRRLENPKQTTVTIKKLERKSV